MGNYKHPEALVSTDWVADHLNDPNVRLVEVDVDTTSYEKGHIQNAGHRLNLVCHHHMLLILRVL